MSAKRARRMLAYRMKGSAVNHNEIHCMHLEWNHLWISEATWSPVTDADAHKNRMFDS
jgi:hypothetical protein